MELTRRLLKALGLAFWPPLTGERYHHVLRCTLCGHTWYPRAPNPPRRCPNCQSRRWFDTRTNPIIHPPELLPDPAGISPNQKLDGVLEIKDLRLARDQESDYKVKPSGGE